MHTNQHRGTAKVVRLPRSFKGGSTRALGWGFWELAGDWVGCRGGLRRMLKLFANVAEILGLERRVRIRLYICFLN